jgi:hypothetical protein
MTSSFAVEATRDERVALACDLYTNSFFEKSVAASFITLIGTLEVLKDQESVTPEAIRLISGWLGKIDQLERSLDFCTLLRAGGVTVADGAVG